MTWEILLHEEVDQWYLTVCKTDPNTAEQIAAALDYLQAEGPTAGRPLVDRVKGSKYHNMKELRPGSTGTTKVRLLFAFDPLRHALILVAGDKSGDWTGWYDTNIPLAEARYAKHQAELEKKEQIR